MTQLTLKPKFVCCKQKELKNEIAIDQTTLSIRNYIVLHSLLLY
ncbi:unnamed protein product [Brugia timori]|uniref:Uncharacterized protein n=1 Tax=Brugia timori TaxID=42155 RepID=A0A0R3R0E9_9BILA|nr:unnamed protein product [Brugia timori]